MWNKDYKDILLSLLNEGADFILVGAYALAAHGFPRATMDIDIWVKPTPDNAAKVYAALNRYGAPMEQITAADFSNEGTVFQIGVAPRRVDILTQISGVNYDEANKDAIEIEIEGISIKILSINHLITNKLATGRAKDIDDADNLRQHLKK